MEILNQLSCTNLITILARVWLSFSLLLLITACQTMPTSVDGQYSGVFSKYDTVPIKIQKLIDLNQYSDAAIVFFQNRETLNSQEFNQLKAKLVWGIEKIYSDALGKIEGVNNNSEVKPDFYTSISLIESSKELINTFDRFSRDLGYKALSQSLNNELALLELDHKEKLHREISSYLADGVPLNYANREAYSVDPNGSASLARSLFKEACINLPMPDKSLHSYYRCVDFNAPVPSVDSASIWPNGFFKRFIHSANSTREFGVDLLSLTEEKRNKYLELHDVEIEKVDEFFPLPRESYIRRNRGQLFFLLKNRIYPRRTQKQM